MPDSMAMARRHAVVAILVSALAALACGAAVADWWRTPAPPGWPMADGFDYPVGGGQATGYYDAQPFGANRHLGEDWNIVIGSDRGHPVGAIGHGVVTVAEDFAGGWGNVVRVEHRYRDGGREHRVESLYAHLHRVDVVVGQVVRRGEMIGTIGDAHGRYGPHLHLELRERPGLPLGPGYSNHRDGYLAPTPFIRARRPVYR
jgi:murein DD-endopeptidase MepM/ murein hydrolase activator NlpD